MADVSFSDIKINDNGSINLSTKVLGVDLNQLVDGYVKAKSVPITRKEVEVSKKSDILSSYQEYENLLKDLKTPAANLRRPSLAQTGTDVFGQKIAYATSSTGGSSTAITVTPKADTPLGTYSLTVNRLARSDAVLSSSVDTFASQDAALITTSGTLSINGTSVAVTAGDSLKTVVDAVNTQTSTTKVRAQIVNLGNGTYRLSLSANEAGKAIALSGSGAGVLDDLNLNSLGSGETDATLSSEVVYNGVTVTRSNNTIRDLIPGASIDLFSANSLNPIRISVETNNQNVRAQVDAFVEAYNALRDFYDTQTVVNGDGTVPEDSVLVNQTAFRGSFLGLETALTGQVSGVPRVNTLRDIGITLDRENRLVVDDVKLNDAIVDKGDAVTKLFGFNSTSSSSDFFVAMRPDSLKSSLGNTDITVRVLETNASGKPTRAEMVVAGVTYNSTQVTISQGGAIVPPEGIGLNGARFGYSGGVVTAGSPAKTSTIKMTQGIADTVASYLDTSLSTDGVIANQKNSIQKDIDKIGTQIATLKTQVADYEKGLRLSLQGSESRVSQLTATQNFLKAQTDALAASN
jgi:flagellar hook-associated protein 2